MSVQPSSHTVRGTNVRMLRHGSGPPLLYLHGANGLTPWLPFYERLAEKFEVFIPEHPGFGLSDNPPWIRNVADLAMYYLDFLDTLGGEKVNLAGQSLGGWVAAELAVRNCSRLASLTLMAPAGIRVKGIISGDNFIWDPEEAVRNLFHDQSFADKILGQQLSEDEADIALTNRFAATKFGWEPRWFNPGLERWLHRISVPTQVLWGENDKLFPVDYAKRWGERIPGSRIDIIPQCGHAIAIEKADLAAQKIISLAGRQ